MTTPNQADKWATAALDRLLELEGRSSADGRHRALVALFELAIEEERLKWTTACRSVEKDYPTGSAHSPGIIEVRALES